MQVPLEGGSRGERNRCAQLNRHLRVVFVARKVSAFVKTGKKCEPANERALAPKNDSQSQPLSVHILKAFNIQKVNELLPSSRQHPHRQLMEPIYPQLFPSTLESQFVLILVGFPQLQKPAHHAPA